MEVVGTAAAIIQLAGVGFTLAKTLYALYDEGASGNEQIKDLSLYIRSTSIAFEEVGKIFEVEGKAATPLVSQNALITAKDVVTRCTEIFTKLKGMAEDGQKNTIGLLAFLLKGSRLRVMQTKLDQSKVDLQLMMQLIIYARLRFGPPEEKKKLDWSEPDQRQVVVDCIEKRDALYEQERQARNQEEQDLEDDAHLHPALFSTTDVGPQNPASGSGGTQENDQSPAPEAGHAPSNGSGKGTMQPSSDKPQGNGPIQNDVSYWSALYLVCCPCVRVRAATVGSSLEGPPALPPNQMQYMPPGPAALGRTTRPQDQSRIHEDIIELPAIPEPQSNTPANWPITPCPMTDQYMASLGQHEASVSSPGVASGSRVPLKTVHDLKLDQFLRQWTTVYDKPSFFAKSKS